MANEAVAEHVRQHGAAPRYRGNRLIFLAPDHGALTRLRDSIRTVLAWNSIVEDVAAMRLVLDNLQAEQAKKELKGAEDVLPRSARETYKWLLCPAQEKPTEPKHIVEAVSLNTSGGAVGPEIERVCLDNEWVISTWSPIHLRTKLSELYWKADKPVCAALAFWEDTLRYLYLPRLKTKDVLAQAISKGAPSRDFFGTAYGQHQGKFDGFKLGGSNIQLDDTLLLIEPGAADAYEKANQPKPEPPPPGNRAEIPPVKETGNQPPPSPQPPQPTKAKAFHGSVAINASTAKMRLLQVAEEIISALAADPNAELKVSVEISANFPNGVQDQTKRAVSENAKTLGFKNADWE